MSKRAIRAAFERAAVNYDQAAFLQQEVARRLAERLDVMKLAPQRILDAGCGTGFGLPLLRARYPDARILGLDLALAMLKLARARHARDGGLLGWLARLRAARPQEDFLCGDIERLPLAGASIDLVWSNLTLQWLGDLPASLREVHRVIRPGGLFIFSTFGPDTLKELRQAFAGVDGYNHVNRFIDMHDIGDMLLAAGFAQPVMEMEYITLTYTELKSLLRELKAIGADTVLEGRRRGLMGQRLWQRLCDNYERFRRAGRLPATFEVIYGHAWAALEKHSDGRKVIQWHIQQRGAGV